MPSKSSSKQTRSKAPVANPKRQSKKPVATKLWVADDKLFHEIATRRHIKPALLLRDIVHDWAVTFRLSRQPADAGAGDVRTGTFDQQILAEQLGPMKETLSTIVSQINRLNDPQNCANTNALVVSPSQPDLGTVYLQTLTVELASMKEELSALRAFAVAHYMLSGQTFINTWAVLHFAQYIAERFLVTEFKNNHKEEATTRRDEARLDALELLQQMSLELDYPAPFKPILWTPSE